MEDEAARKDHGRPLEVGVASDSWHGAFCTVNLLDSS